MKTLNLLVCLSILLTSTLLVSCSEEKQTVTPNGIEYYTCPMHPEVHSDKSGKCPSCGMDLVKYKELKAPAEGAK
jgi:hypothetical protein